MKKVFLADDHVLVRTGIRSLLEKLPDIEVLGEASNGRETLEKIRVQAPDIVLMDIAMSGLNGFDTTSSICKEFPAIRVLMLSMYTHEEYVLQALRAGASGFLRKDAAAIELELALHALSKGEVYLSPGISRHVVNALLHPTANDKAGSEALSPRQREVLQLIAEGKTVKEIALLLHLSVKTVETHRADLMDKLKIHDVAGLVRYALRIGLIAPE
ncbi:MAG TPA: response regulator transcription factor [Bacillota bacterium]|nr:response regulator transcription factor [Bacillota bacterium]